MSIYWWKHEARSRADHVTESLNPESDLIVNLPFSTSFRKSYHFQLITIVLRACSLLVDWDPYHLRSKDESTDNERLNERKRDISESDSRWIVHDLSASTWFAIRLDQIRTHLLQTSLRFVRFEDDSSNFWSSNRFLFQVQISRNDDEQSINMKTSSETSEREIDQQIEHINDSNRVHLKCEHRRSSSNLFDHRIASIHLLCLDLIRSQWETQF
jgi:hypothetical protein